MSSVTPQLLDTAGPHRYLVLFGRDYISCLEYLPDGQRVVTGSRDGTVRVRNLESGKQEGVQMKHEGHVTKLTATRDGTKIISSGWSGKIKVWDVKSHELVKEWTYWRTYPKISISPDDRLMAVGSWDVDIWTMEGRHIHSIKVGSSIWSLCFSPDGSKLACGTGYGTQMYDVASGMLILGPLDGGGVTDMVWSRDGSRLFSCSHSTIRCWNSDTGQQIGHPWTGHTAVIHSLSLSPDGTILASVSWDKTARFWNTTTGDPVGQHPHRCDAVNAVCFSPCGEFVATAGWGTYIYICRVVERLVQRQLSNFKYVFSAACSMLI